MSATPATLLCTAGDYTDLIIPRSELEAIAGPTLRVEGHHSGAGLAATFVFRLPIEADRLSINPSG